MDEGIEYLTMLRKRVNEVEDSLISVFNAIDRARFYLRSYADYAEDSVSRDLIRAAQVLDGIFSESIRRDSRDRTRQAGQALDEASRKSGDLSWL